MGTHPVSCSCHQTKSLGPCVPREGRRGGSCFAKGEHTLYTIMGGPNLEIARMVAYMAFPIIVFYYANQEQLFKKYVLDVTDEKPLTDVPKNRDQMQAAYDDMVTRAQKNRTKDPPLPPKE